MEQTPVIKNTGLIAQEVLWLVGHKKLHPAGDLIIRRPNSIVTMQWDEFDEMLIASIGEEKSVVADWPADHRVPYARVSSPHGCAEVLMEVGSEETILKIKWWPNT